MSVIINDFEVVIESPQDTEPGSAGVEAAAAAPSPGLGPQDIRDILKRQAERMARLRAN